MRSQILVLFLFLSSSFATDDVTPAQVNAIEAAQCFIDTQLSSEDCAHQEVSCSEEIDDFFVSFADIPYTNCILEICKNAPNDLMQVMNDRNDRASERKPEIVNRFKDKINGLYDVIHAQAKEADEYLKANPDYKRKLDINENLYILQKILVEKIQNDVNPALRESLDNREEFIKVATQSMSGWSESLADKMWLVTRSHMNRLVPIVREANVLTRSLVNQEGRRQFLGRMEARIRALPDGLPQKHQLFNEIIKLQSQNQLENNPSNILPEKGLELTLELELLQFMSDPTMATLKEAIFDEAKALGVHSEVRIGPEAIEGSDREVIVDWCANSIARQVESFPTRAKKQELVRDVNTTRELIKTRMARFLSRETSQGVALAFDSTDISLPPAQEDFLSRMEGHLQEVAGMMQANDQLNRVSASAYHSNSFPLTNIENFCEFPLYDDREASAWTHANESRNGQIHNVSMGNFYMLDFHNTGRFVLAHELGHIASSHIRNFGSRDSKRAHKETKSCLNRNQSGGVLQNLLGQVTGDLRATGSKEEEDFADLYAQYALPYNFNPKCIMFNQGQPADLQTASLWSSGQAPHSSDFYRLLHMEVARNGRLPNICREELQREGDDFREVNCWVDAPTITQRRLLQLPRNQSD